MIIKGSLDNNVIYNLYIGIGRIRYGRGKIGAYRQFGVRNPADCIKTIVVSGTFNSNFLTNLKTFLQPAAA